ncbi:uncharacterized protein LOC135152013 [Daucus carota subsp. sativus]|uniref:uncharacterized protein LOC135152013 n=1 Tax=Daucus carota subsp. sativus TaxID=79200 RepID=UPI003082B488
MESFLEAQVPMLTGTNYGDWSIQMKELLHFYNIWDIVESGYNEPTKAAEVALSDAEKTTLNGCRSKNNKACFMIYQGVDESTFDNIAHEKKAKDAWEILQKSFHGVDKEEEVEPQVLHDEFENMKMKNSGNIEENVTRLKTVTNKMKGNGKSLDTIQVMEKQLHSVTTKFDYVITTIEESKYLSTISIEGLACLLQAHELRINRYDEEMSNLESMLLRKVSDNCSPSSGLINISGEAPRSMLSPDNIYKATSPIQTTVDNLVFCFNASNIINKIRESVHHKIAERVNYMSKEILDDIFIKSLKWGIFHKAKEKEARNGNSSLRGSVRNQTLIY